MQRRTFVGKMRSLLGARVWERLDEREGCGRSKLLLYQLSSSNRTSDWKHTRNRTLPQELDQRSALSSCRGLPETLGREHLESETWFERIRDRAGDWFPGSCGQSCACFCCLVVVLLTSRLFGVFLCGCGWRLELFMLVNPRELRLHGVDFSGSVKSTEVAAMGERSFFSFFDVAQQSDFWMQGFTGWNSALI